MQGLQQCRVGVGISRTRKFLGDGDGLVGIGGIESLLVIQLCGAGAVFEPVLLFDELDAPRGDLQGAGIIMATEQGVSQKGLSTAGGAGQRPLFAFINRPVESIQQRGAAELYGNPFQGEKFSHGAKIVQKRGGLPRRRPNGPVGPSAEGPTLAYRAEGLLFSGAPKAP